MSLAGLLPWAVFLGLAGLHVLAGKRFYDNEILGPKSAFAVIIAVLCAEIAALSYRSGPLVVFMVRDMILVLALVRLFMKKTPREIYQIVGISFSQCLLSTIFTISPLFLIGVLLMIILVPMILYELDERDFDASARASGNTTAHWAVITGCIVLAASVLFYILPRPSSSLIKHGFVQRNRFALSEDVNLRKTSADNLGSEIMLRVVWVHGKAPSMFYLSGSRLEKIGPDGFFKGEDHGSAPVSDRAYSDIVRIYPALIESRYVFFPFWIKTVSPRNYRIQGSDILWSGVPPMVYDAWVSRIPGQGTPGSVDLPQELAAVRELGVRIAGQGDTKTRVERLAGYLRTNFTYSLERQQIPPEASAITWFAFTGRKGSCEHFAAALGAMIRGCGIPARVVTGFLVREYNEGGDYYIVRASDAHAWVEYYDGAWTTIDATPYGRPAPLMRFHILDELRFRWLRWVIQYSLDDQIRFAVNVLTARPRINKQVEKLPLYFVVVFTGALLSWMGVRAYIDRSRSPYDKVRRAFSRKGLVLPENISHEDHLLIIQQRMGALESEFHDYLRSYLLWRFREDEVDINSLTSRMVKRIRTTPVQ